MLTRKIINYGTALLLIIGGALIITNVIYNNISIQSENTGPSSIANTIDEPGINIEESLNAKKQAKEDFQSIYNELNCNESDDGCTSSKINLKNLIDGLDATIDCDTRIISKNNLEKSDISFCINAEEQLRDAFKNFYIIEDGECNSKCEEDLNVYNHNIKIFQDFLSNLD